MIERRTFLTACGAALAAGTVGAADDNAPPKKRFRVIDTHLHLMNARAMDAAGFPKISYLNQDATVEGCLEAMRRGGIDKAFLITYNAQDVAPQLQSFQVDPAIASVVYNNKYQKAAWKKHPDIFWWFPDHIDPTREGYLDDLQQNFEEGAAGIKLMTVFHGYFPDHPGYHPVFEMCRKYKKPVVMDISFWYLGHMLPANELAHRRNRVKRWSDYGKILEPIFKEFSDVPISLAHAGTPKRESDFDEILPFIASWPNVSCDLAAATHMWGGSQVESLERLVKEIGSHKIMYGTDWPYWASGKDSYVNGTYRISYITEDAKKLTDDDRRLILAENAERFVRFELPQKAKSKT